jgi:hypothetical protein
MYTRCDGLWTCPNGEDEDNCYQTECSKGTHPCISLFNNSLICLSSEKAGNGIPDCLGATDEIHFCRRVYPAENDPKRFRCQNSDLCLSSFELCNNIQSCPLGDDENFCNNHRFLCQSNSNSTIIENLLCRWSENEKNRIIYFFIHTSPNYPPLENLNQNQTIYWQSQQNSLIKQINSSQNSYSWSWYCNRGLIVRIRISDEEIKRGCMCPPSYYGDLCQYQNERISLTLRLVRAERRDVYVIILMLIDEDELIDSYDQFEYIASQSCGMKLNRYLLYSNRSKNLSKTYHVRIDAYDKNTMTYRGSWYLSIPFLFLPVNRLSALLFLPYQQSLSSSKCLMKCEHGECIHYLNKEDEESFCRCYSGWSGIQCNIPINCQRCSSDSICLGSMNNQSICICPLMKFGPRCLLSSSCPKNACQNNGQCIPTDMSLSKNDYSCICSDQYYGLRCEYLKSKLDIYLENLDIPSYILAYFFTISNQSEPRLTIILQKLTLFQRMVTFRISIPYHLVLVKSNRKYYLAVIQSYSNPDITTIINPSRECHSIEILFNSTILKLSRYQRIKSYHIPCQQSNNLNCFVDEYYLCLCTKDHHVNCIELNFNKINLQCSSKYSCQNGAQCLQDHSHCPSSIICVCIDCFFGNQCQFYAKGLGLTLDEIKRNVHFSKQTFSVQLSAILTMLIFLAGLIMVYFRY